jgi:hypothetical protein
VKPRQNLIDARAALLAGRPREVRARCCDYFAWRHRDGFEPTFLFEFCSVDGDEYARTLVGCAQAHCCRQPLEFPAVVTWEVPT